MKRIGILGDIGSGKSYVAQSFGYPVFDADKEVSILYKTDKRKLVQHSIRRNTSDLSARLPNWEASFVEIVGYH